MLPKSEAHNIQIYGFYRHINFIKPAGVLVILTELKIDIYLTGYVTVEQIDWKLQEKHGKITVTASFFH